MAIRTILHYPDERLRIPGKPVTKFDEDFQTLIDDMAETMYAAPGVGLAATQIGVSLNVFIVDVSQKDEESELRVFANPAFVVKEGSQKWDEGCLSFPGVTESIERAGHVVVRAQDRHGETFEIEAEGLMAVALQHENDHLEGKLMIDHLSMLKRRMVHRTLSKS